MEVWNAFVCILDKEENKRTLCEGAWSIGVEEKFCIRLKRVLNPAGYCLNNRVLFFQRARRAC